MKKAKKQNVGMIFDEHSNPVAIYWKNGTLKYFKLREMNETDMDYLWDTDKPEEK